MIPSGDDVSFPGWSPQRAVALLCGEADYTVPPRAPRPASGLVEQQRWFMKAAGRGD